MEHIQILPSVEALSPANKSNPTQRIENPTMMTIRQTAKTGILSEHALRVLLKAGRLPAVYVGKRALINYNALCQQLTDLGKKPLV